MANQSVLELAVNTGKWDAGLKKATNSLHNFITSNGGLTQALDKEGQSMMKFIGMMGKMDSTARTAKGQMNDYKGAIEQLTMQYNHLSDAEKKTFGPEYLRSIDMIKDKYQAVAKEVQDMNKSLSTLPEPSGGSLFSRMGDKMTGAMQVFAGNMMTKATMAVADFGNEMMEAVQQSVELAKSAEGIRAAYDRLGNAHLMAQLKEETHGTVSELQLMKAAVKFNDFGLPVKELGTMLAFAQQKAKDTGQSVDYMVDSIVTGLGRKSKLILDNLGISAADIDEHMKKTGDMTLAVGEIIREQMGKAGDYVETAADRAAKANADLENAMLRLGDTFKPLTDSASSMWNSIKIGAIDLLNNAVKPLINALTVAGRLRASLQQQTGVGSDQEFVNRQLSGLRGSNNKKQRYQASLSYYDREIEWRNQYAADITAWQRGQRGAELQRRIQQGQKRSGSDFLDANLVYRQIEALSKRRAMYMQGADAIFNPVKPDKGTGGTGTTDDKKGGKTSTKTKPQLTLEQQTALDVQKAEKGYADALAMAQTKLIENVTTSDEYDKEIQKGQQSLADAYLKAYTATGDEKYLTAYRETADHVKTLQEGIDQHTKAQKEAAEDLKRQSLNLGSTGGIAALISTLKSDQAAQTIGSQEWEGTGNQLAAATGLSNIVSESLKSGIDPKQVEAITAPLREALSSGIIDKDKLNEEVLNALSDINALLQEQGLEPIKLDIKTGDIKGVTKEARGMSKEWQYAASAIGQVGQAMSNIEDPAAKVMGTIAQSIATIALGYAQATAKAAEMGPWAWIAFAAASTATMISMISSVHSATGYAQGGIVKGDSYSGDNIPANTFVNAGELVLNRAQQGNLASQLEQGGGAIGGGTPYVTGETIFLGLNNYMRSHGYGELIPSRR